MSSAWVTTFEKEHLWMYLQVLGFELGLATVACGKMVSHTHLRVNMFDKLNREAFQIVSYFLFQTLDQSLSKEVFKLCWPPFDQKSDTEFRKHCCEWLKKISAECGSSFPQVVGSLFLSPGGPKFIHVMYHFARFVAIKYIKTHSKNSSENAQLSVKQARNLRSECIGQQNQIKKMEPYDDQSNIQENIQKVRSLWASVNETFMFLEKEGEVVSSVLSLVNQYTLDGTNVAINIPRLLPDKIEKQMCQLHIGNVYEAGKLNLLTVIQLLNEVLKVMKYEHCQADQARLTKDLHFLEKETKFQRERLSDLKHMRYKIKEDLTTVRHSIVEKQEEWHKIWKEFLGLSPFSLIKGWTPAVDLLPPITLLHFQIHLSNISRKMIARRASDILETKCDLAKGPASFLWQLISPSDRNSVTLLENDRKLTSPREKNETVSKKTPEFEGSSSSNIAKNQDHLVEEVARAVLSDSPQPSKGKEVMLEELIDSLVSNPLISDIRSSWRKAVKIEDNRSTEPIQMVTEHREVLPESSPVVHNQKEFNMASFFSTTTVSDSSHSRLPEEKVVSDCLKCVIQKPVVASYVGEPTTQHLSDLLNKDIICKRDLECTALQNKLLETSHIETLSPAIGNRRDVIGSSEE
eukprot:bmy_18518T0